MKTLADEWDTVVAAIAAVRNADAETQLTMKRCFYAGALVVFSCELEIARNDNVPDKEAAAILKKLYLEAVEFFFKNTQETQKQAQ